jgi:hypothetical protein
MYTLHKEMTCVPILECFYLCMVKVGIQYNYRKMRSSKKTLLLWQNPGTKQPRDYSEIPELSIESYPMWVTAPSQVDISLSLFIKRITINQSEIH